MSHEANIKLLVECGAELAVRQLSAHDELSRPFELDVIAVSQTPLGPADKDPDRKGAALRLDWLACRGAALRIEQADGRHRVWTGVCAAVEQLRWDETPGAESTYHLRIVPYLWLLSQRTDHRIFQHQSIPDIVKTVFGTWSLRARYELAATYPKKHYCVQYGESDLAFVSRLLEEAGIVYYFGHRDAGEGKVESEIVLTDCAHLEPSRATLPYVASPNPTALGPHVTDVALSHGVRPGSYVLGDYDFRRPHAPLFAASRPAQGSEAARALYRFEPGGFRVERGSPAADEPRADLRGATTHDGEGEGRLRAERFLAAERFKKRAVAFATNVQSLGPGTVFTVSGHGGGAASELDGALLLVCESMTQVSAAGDWSVVAEALFAADGPVRAPRVTPKPRVAGVQSAIVVGPEGQEIFTDEYGRVRVRFHWDRDGAWDDTCSAWLRVSQAWAGQQYGTLMIPRVGHEVIVDFFDGDPDEPIVVGSVYNVPSPPPYKLPEHARRATWQTSTTPDRPGARAFNELMFDDTAGAELVFLQAERNALSLTKERETERTGANRTVVVGRDRLGVVAGVDAAHAGDRHLFTIVKAGDLGILELGEPRWRPGTTFIELDKSGRIELATGQASIVLDGADITLETKEGLRLSADRELVIEGSLVYFNVLPGARASRAADPALASRVLAPEGDVLNSVLRLFGAKYAQKQKARASELAIAATLEHGVGDMPKPLKKDDPTTGTKLAGKPFVDGPSPNDVSQGAIGDCYLMASMAAVAHAQPKLLERNITENPDGTVNIEFKDGTVKTDTEVPAQGSSPRYGTAMTSGETWPSLLEKGYAYQYGGGEGYEGVGNGGWPAEAMSHITGGRSTTQYLSAADASNPDKRAALLKSLSEAGTKPTVACSRKPTLPADHPRYVPSGNTVGNHAYTVLGTKKNDKGEDVVLLRNPWGSHDGRNPWKDTGQDGNFEMPVENFVADFGQLDVNTPPAGAGGA
ncbi:MAG: type VI secretion system tip protein VgrG [Myxococcales bacterium]|nr:type VI secretion system tip protein VgrG [Myxococcales bacterium]